MCKRNKNTKKNYSSHASFSFLCQIQSKADMASLNTPCFAPEWKCFIFLETSKRLPYSICSLSTHVTLSAPVLSLSTAIWWKHQLKLYPLKALSVDASLSVDAIAVNDSLSVDAIIRWSFRVICWSLNSYLLKTWYLSVDSNSLMQNYKA